LRLAVISYNVLTALKRLALPADLLSARPKRLRFLIFYTAGAPRSTDALAAGQGGGENRPVAGSPPIPTASYLTRK